MTPEQVADVLLVQAAEEVGSPALPPEARIDALEAAGELDDERAWFARRARHLLGRELAAYRPLLRVRDALAPPLAWTLALAGLVGLASNALGPHEQIHVLYNPIAALVAWNVGLYATLALAPLGRRGRRPILRSDAGAPPATPAGARREPSRRGGLWALILRRGLPLFLARLRRDVRHAGDSAAEGARVARRFWSLWLDAAPGVPANALRSHLHLAAAALAMGAIAGMFVRGVFFEYAMVWRSTFVREPDTIAAVLRVVLGPAAWLLGQPLPSAADAALMRDPLGAPAARWIALWAATALGLVAAPRLWLAAFAARRRRILARRVLLPLDDAYFTALLAGVRKLQIERIESAIGADVRDAIGGLAASTAGFVCERLYDARLVPRLRAFRETGGSVSALERGMEAECRAFEPELEGHLAGACRELEAALRASVERSVGARLGEREAPLAIGAAELWRGSLATLGGSVGREISNAVGAAVSAGVGLVAASLSGGFGHHLGIAVLVALLHTSGPVGFLVGGLGGAAVAAAGWYGGREWLARAMKRLRLPRPLARIALRQRALERLVVQGREQCGRAVRERIAEELAPLVPRVAEEIFAKLRASLPVRLPVAADRAS